MWLWTESNSWMDECPGAQNLCSIIFNADGVCCKKCCNAVHIIELRFCGMHHNVMASRSGKYWSIRCVSSFHSGVRSLGIQSSTQPSTKSSHTGGQQGTSTHQEKMQRNDYTRTCHLQAGDSQTSYTKTNFGIQGFAYPYRCPRTLSVIVHRPY
jgi:hypothetical protein